MVKRIMIPLLVTTLMLMAISPAWGALNTFSINIVSGDAELDRSSEDLSQLTFGLTVPLNNKVEFNGELSTGEIGDEDSTAFKLKADYRIYQDRKVRLDLAGGYYQRTEDYWSDYKISTFFVGIDGRIRLDNRLSLYTGLGIGLMPEEKQYGFDGDPESLYLFHLKLNYLLNSKFGLSVGYFSESFESDLYSGDTTYKGVTAGAFFRF